MDVELLEGTIGNFEIDGYKIKIEIIFEKEIKEFLLNRNICDPKQIDKIREGVKVYCVLSKETRLKKIFICKPIYDNVLNSTVEKYSKKDYYYEKAMKMFTLSANKKFKKQLAKLKKRKNETLEEYDKRIKNMCNDIKSKKIS